MDKRQIVFVALAVIIGICLGTLLAEIFSVQGCGRARYYTRGEYLPALLDEIAQAESSIELELYNFTKVPQMIQALEDAASRGVQIKIFLDNQGANDPNSKTGIPERRFETLGISVHWEASSVTMHKKLAIIDRCTICCGSHNWTENGFFNNFEVSSIYCDDEDAQKLGLIFEKDWAKSIEDYPAQLKKP